ncbi:MAG: 2-hydroxychromene-2-carboxylate isomerase [Rhodomicrobiaceae bacterium]
MAKLEFWYDFASTYSYLTAMRIEPLAKDMGVVLDWKPFLLGPIFQAQGWVSSPFNLYPNKGRYMVRDIERLCAERGLPFKMGSTFPQNSLKAARLGIVAAEEGWAPAYTREVYLLQFRDGADISDEATLAKAVAAVGQEPDALLARLQDQTVKDALRAQTEKAASLEIFGAPTFVTRGGEMFWGDDRLERALNWALDHETTLGDDWVTTHAQSPRY